MNEYMSSNMNLKSSRTRIALPASIAYERLVTGMNQFMCFEMPLSDELLRTTFKTTNERSFSSLKKKLKKKAVTCVLKCVFRLPVSVNSLKQCTKGQVSILFSPLGRLAF